MSQHLPPGFSPLDLDGLGARAQTEALDHLAGCPTCAAGFDRAAEALTGLSLGLDPAPPPPALWARLSASVDALGRFEGRFARWAGPVARLLDLPAEQAAALLADLDRPAAWVPGPVPECWIHQVEPGAGRTGALAAFVKIAAGAGFPRHRHLGAEQTLVLQGTYRTDGGEAHGAGEEQAMAGGSSHALVAGPGPDLLYLAVVDGGIEIGGVPFRGARG